MARRGAESCGRRAEEGAGKRERFVGESFFSFSVSARGCDSLASSPFSLSLSLLLHSGEKDMIHDKNRFSPAPLEESLLSPRGGAASLWRSREEEERVERREVGDAPVVVVIGAAAAPAAELVHLFLLGETSEPELVIAGREAEAEATTGRLEAARGAAEGAAAAAVAIEQRIFRRWCCEKRVLSAFSLQAWFFSLSSLFGLRAGRALAIGNSERGKRTSGKEQ